MRSEVIYVYICDIDGRSWKIEYFRGLIYYNYSEGYGNNSKTITIKPSKEKWKCFWRTCLLIDCENWKDKYFGHPFGHAPYLEIEIQSKNIFATYSGDYVYSNDNDEDELGDLFDVEVVSKETTRIGHLIIAVRDLIGGLPFG